MTSSIIASSLSSDARSPRRLVDKLAAGTPYAVAFGGQGTPWLEPLADLVRTHGLELGQLVEEADRLLQPVAVELLRADAEFEPLRWVDAVLVPGADEDATGVPDSERLLAPTRSLPGIALAQLAALRAVHHLGLDPRGAAAATGHSQGCLAVEVVRGADEVEMLAVARLLGAAAEVVGRRRGLLGETMLSLPLPVDEVEELLAQLPESSRLVARIRNGRRSTVVSGPEQGIERLRELVETLEGVEPETVLARAAFHHPELAAAADLAAEWAARCGLDADRVRALAQQSLVDPIDWPAAVTEVLDSGARWLLDLGPADLAAQLSSPEARALGVGVLAPATSRGLRELTVAGAAPRRERPWTAYAPEVVVLPDGTPRVETGFTRLTGRSPIVLAGMTPTTVDPAIVAAAANAGHWAELAGGGQVTEPVFKANVARLTELLEPGRTVAFNALYLDPYLWRLQVGGQRLVQRARSGGAAFDSVVVTAGIPELDEATALVSELAEAGIEHTVFKPGTVAQIKQVLAIADAVAPTPLIVQIEGGKAGGHHSWEDLDALLLATYADLRRRDNVVVCVGGGIGTPEAAARYITGAWAEAHGERSMPLDGVLVGTAAMACLEATTSPQVKQLLVDTPGTPEWVRAGEVAGGVTSGRSQLGADLHEVDNTSARCGRLLDEVAGDDEAVAARRDEIVTLLEKTAKPYFGDVAEMTYAQWLVRFLELSGTPEWLDVTVRDRFHAMLQRAEARLAEADHGDVPTLFPSSEDVEDGTEALARLLAAHPDASAVQLHPADVPFFVEVCRRPGKPVPFVPVIDGGVRRWWRSDSLWQAHDAKYDADAVSVIPGPVSVAGITRVDEPVAELLDRFEAAVVDAASNGREPARVVGRRRDDEAAGAVALALAAPDAVWAGRTVVNPVRRLGGDWLVTGTERAEHPATGSVLTGDGDVAELAVPLGRTTLTLRLSAGPEVATGAAPVVLDVAESMRTLLELAAGGLDTPLSGSTDGSHHGSQTGESAEPGVLTTARFVADLVGDHAAVTSTGDPRAVAVPDALVGLAWPAVFAALSDREDVTEGMLDLVHLDHAITGAVPDADTDLAVAAVVRDVTDTEVGRVVTVDVGLLDLAAPAGAEPVATLVERFAIRGRAGDAPLADPDRAGGSLDEVTEAGRVTRARATVTAPADLRAFAAVTGDHNPIHTTVAAARLAGLGSPIVHGMWTSAVAQRVVVEQAGRPVKGWTSRFLGPVRPDAAVEVTATRTGIVDGDEVLEVSARVEGELVLVASARLTAPRTAYVFPGQGIQHAGMGMAGYARCRAAREVWDRADDHTREVLGFSILDVVRDNPTELDAADGVHRHPDGVLFLTQFTQVAMAVLAAAQMAELVEAGVAVDDAFIAGHSVGEYNALAAVSGVLSLEAVVEVVFQRGSVMHTLVPRDEHGRSDFRMAAIRPAQIGVADDDVRAFVTSVGEESGEFLEIANYNLRGSQYAIAGTVRGLEALEAEVERRRAEFGGRAAYVLVPGVDVPFHSSVLRGGVEDFRAKLDELLPPTVDPALLVGRYVPNLVARPFSLDRAFMDAIIEVVPSVRIQAVLSDWDAWTRKPGALCRLVLVELLAWQFASPVRWIETQDLMFRDAADGGLGVERVVEVGVGRAPTVANLASTTLKLPAVRRTLAGDVEVLNVERDADTVFARDEDQPEPDPIGDDVDSPSASGPGAEAGSQAAPAAVAALPAVTAGAAPSGADVPRPADLSFTAGDATRVLLAWWTKVRPDQLGDADTIESLCDGVSSRRNQLLVDLGTELGLGAIDGAAEADVPTLTAQVTKLARGYKPLGPVLSSAVGDHLRKVLGPVGVRQSAVTDRVTGTWQLGQGWATHVLVELAAATRDGASVRGGDLAAGALPTSRDELDASVDAAVQAVAARHGVSVALPSTGGGEVTVDAAALAGVTGEITGALVASAKDLLRRLGDSPDAAVEAAPDDEAAAIVARVEAELGPDWMRATAPVFDERRAVLLDDRWASAREDVARIAAGEDLDVDLTGAGEVVASHARWYGLDDLARLAEDTTRGAWADDVALVTGAGRGSIASAVVGRLLAGGATVVATTSSTDPARLAYFRQLYRTHARVGAALWVVPANMGSYADVDALVAWVTSEQSRRLGPTTEVVKPALRPTLMLPFAAGPVSGDLADAGPRAEQQARILLWSVERLIGADWGHSAGHRVHVVLPGSPNRGTFGGDGAYGEVKAALDAVVAKWSSEPSWSEGVTLAHAVIGWVAGTGLMGGNDPLVDAARDAGVRVWETAEMADQLLALCTPAARESAAERPLHADLAEGLEGLDLRELAKQHPALAPAGETSVAEPDVPGIPALPPSPARLELPAQPELADVPARPEDLVVIVGAGELGPWGSSRTRHEAEVGGLSAAGVLELAWCTGLVRWDDSAGSWYDVASGDAVAEHEIRERYHDAVVERCGIRRYEDDGSMVGNTAPLLQQVFLDDDLTFRVDTEADARALQAADPAHTVIAPDGDGWAVTRKAGTEIRVPRRLDLTRTVGGQVPSGFDPSVWGIPAEMLESLDRLAVWNLVCTVDAFLSSGFTPSELMRWVHPARVANTQGTGLGGMTSMQSLYLDTLLGESVPNDLLQEALPNVVAAHVVQSYVGGYGAMVHPVAACATTAVSIEEGVDKIKLGKADFVVAGGYDDLGTEGIIGFAAMSATADTEAMRAQGIDDRTICRPNDRRRGGFVEGQGGGTLLLARGDVAARAGLPVLGVVAYAASFADGMHTSIPAPGLGALAAGLGRTESPLARSLAALGLTADDIALVSKHDTSTTANDPNESELHERLAAAIGRSAGNPLLVVSQKSLTGHAKGGAAAFQVIGLCQVLRSGVVPGNRSLDCVDPVLDEHPHLVWPRSPLAPGPLKAGLVTSLGFGHVAGLLAVAHPAVFLQALASEDRDGYVERARQREVEGRLRMARTMLGEPAFERAPDRRLGSEGVREREADMLLDESARLSAEGVFQCR